MTGRRTALLVALAVVAAACGPAGGLPGAGVTPSPPPSAAVTPALSPAPGPPEEVVLSPTPPAPAPQPVQAEWARNLRPSPRTFDLHQAVALVNMESGQFVAYVGPGMVTVAYETTAGGRAYWVTGYSAGRGLPNGMAKAEVDVAVSASPPARPSLPASLAGAEWARLPTTQRAVALTFDAGGNDAGVAAILAALARAGAPGTFFLTGRWTEAYPAEARRIAGLHPIGNHTYSHPHLTALPDSGVEDEVGRGEAAIETATGAGPRPLFRFPYGDSDARTLAIVHSLGYGGIRWTVDTWGWKGASAGQSADTVVGRVLGALQPGEIVLMHVGAAEDGSTLDADALPRVIAEIRARGYALVTVDAFV